MRNLLLLVLFLAACAPKERPESEVQHAEAPTTFTRLDGSRFQLSELKGKKVALNFWATWCKPCIAEMPSIAKAQQALGDKVVFVLASEEPVERIAKFAENNQIGLSLVHSAQALEAWGITAIPTTIILNEDGQEIKRITGERDWASAEMLALFGRQ